VADPRAFEDLVARVLQAEGYRTRLGSYVNDWGVDVYAERGDERVAVQAKMYAGSRPVNRRQVFELHGVAAFFDCTGAILATDGYLMPDAEEVAAKLGIRVLRLESSDGVVPSEPTAQVAAPPDRPNSGLDFATIWERSIIPLTGQTLRRSDGSSNTIVAADWGGVTRITSNGERQHIPIEVFRWAIERILANGVVTSSTKAVPHQGSC
jgi:hypothetical protein